MPPHTTAYSLSIGVGVSHHSLVGPFLTPTEPDNLQQRDDRQMLKMKRPTRP